MLREQILELDVDSVLSIQLISETIGPRSSRRAGPVLRLVHRNPTVETLLREKAVQGFLSQVLNSDKTIPSSDLSNRVPSPLPSTAAEAADQVVTAFSNGAILFFWNDRQMTELSAVLDMRDTDNEALFIRLFPMRGG